MHPNIIEFLFVDRLISYESKVWEKIRENKDFFLSKKARYSFSGYAYSQLRRIKSHRKYLLNPPKSMPSRTEFGLPDNTTISKDYHNAILSIPSECLNESMREIVLKERQYRDAMIDWNAYQRWDKERNPARREMEKKYGYDCYIDGTEFLTDSGFKHFDEITKDDNLATILWDTDEYIYESRPKFSVEYDKYVDKFDSLYTGTMYQISGVHNNCMVTSYHNILYQYVEKNTKKTYDWGLEHVSLLPNYFNILNTCTPKTKTYCSKHLFADIPVDSMVYMQIMGWYLSDGTMNFKKGIPSSIRISQRENKKMYPYMVRFALKYKEVLNVTMKGYMHKPNEINKEEKEEFVLIIYNKVVVNKIYNDCGHYEHLKRIPRYVMSLSKRLKERLFNSMLDGDGTTREHKSINDNFIYYTCNSLLANDVQELCFLSGWKSSKWGPYLYDKNRSIKQNHPSYQVFVDKNSNQFVSLQRSTNVTKHDVVNQRVYCFSVKNRTLVTRYNGEISMQGNCKHASHLVRLLKMSVEILRDQKVIIFRPDREELLAIRQGAWSFDQVLEFAENTDNYLESLYTTSDLRSKPNLKGISNLYREICEEHYNIKL